MSTIQEVSAGGVIYQKKGKDVKILLLKDPKGEWTFPKGLIEKGEEKEVAAAREIGEEVSIHKLRLIALIDQVHYMYKRKDTLVSKTVYFFLFESVGDEEPTPQREEEIQDAQWFDVEKAQEILGYKKTNASVLSKAIERVISLDT